MELNFKKSINQLASLVLLLFPAMVSIAGDYPVAFNCVERGANGINGRLHTKLSNSVSAIDIVALDERGQQKIDWQTTEGDVVTVAFVDGSGASSCTTRAPIAVSQQQIQFVASDNGRKTIQIAWPNIASRNVMCRVIMSVVGQGSNTSCSRDHFSLRPQQLTLNAPAATADGLGIDTTAKPIIHASTAFHLVADSETAGYDGTPKLDSTKVVAHQGAVEAGAITGQFAQASRQNGQASAQVFYSEVGYFRLDSHGVFDDDFTAVDAASGDCVIGFASSGNKPACYFGNQQSTAYFGRFVPSHFSISADTTESVCNTGFTYFGQEGLTTRFKIAAYNDAQQITKNYTDQFAKIDLSNWDDYQFTATGLPSGTTLAAASNSPSGVWQAGIADVIAQHQVTKANVPTAPAAIQLNIAALDTDGVTMPTTTVGQASEFRYGRLNLSNAYGSELLALTFPVEAQYWNGAVYVRNLLDSCTIIPPESIAMTNYQKNLSACETALSGGGLMQQGIVDVQLTAPGAGNNGSTELQLNVEVANGSTCVPNNVPAISADTSWFGANAYANATFGLYKSPVVYMRENF